MVVLGVASFLDLRDGEVPDFVFLVGILGGLLLHRADGLMSGSFEPFVLSLGLGLGFFVLGWSAYLKGVWGGADALAFSLLGFAAPSGLDPGFHLFDLMFNLMVAILVYSVLFVFWKSLKTEGFYDEFWSKLVDEKYRLVIELSLASVFTLFLSFIGLKPVFYASLLVFMVFLYRFLSLAEEEVFTETVSVDELEGGEVLAEKYLDGKIRGVSTEELEALDVDTVEVRDGVRLVPVFFLALVLTDLGLLGFDFLVYFVG